MARNTLRQLRHGFNRPFMVMFETTLHCNMKCVYCAIWQNQQPEDRAVRDRVFARMDEAAKFGVFAWSFSGGEPLMNPHMPEYIDYAARKGFYTSMPTNGLALKRYADACVKLDQLEVSIDTLDREKFAQRRGIDGLPTLLAALDYIKGNLKHNTIQINAAVDLENLEDLPALADYCEERGFLLHTEGVPDAFADAAPAETIIEDAQPPTCPNCGSTRLVNRQLSPTRLACLATACCMDSS
jgi:MoaA/NifB/PqqE/SkfB family radical SAM enzyme